MENQFPKATVKRSVRAGRATEDYIFAPVLVCDLDGTIRYNEDNPEDFIDGPDSVAVFDGVEEKLWEYHREGYVVVGLTNQGGVAYDFKTPEQVDREVKAMLHEFDRSPFMYIRSCMSHPDGDISPYDRRSLLRKPYIGMLGVLEDDLREAGYLANWDDSLVVGDMDSDRKLAAKADVDFEWAHKFFDREPILQTDDE